MLTRWILCACMASLTQAAILPTNLEPKVGADYQPVDPDERDIWRGLARVEQAIRTSPQRLVAPELEAYTRGVVERLIGRPAPDLRIYFMHDASLNAAMLPNGMMIVNTGLLARVRNEAQLAAVLAHEAGHYFRKHSLELHRDTSRKSSIATAAASTLNSHDESLGTMSLMNQAIMLSGLRFSRDLESEADAYGLMLMARSGYPPRAASAIWGQLVDERRASAAARQKRYRDEASSALSTHPPTESRMTNLADTADYLAGKQSLPGSEGGEEWAAVALPYQAMLLKEQIYLNDPGASLYLLENLARDGWSALLRFNEGEVYRLRRAKGDDLKAAAAYAKAAALADAPADAWRALGYALLNAGNRLEANEALNRYLVMKPDASDAAMVHVALTRQVTAEEIREADGEMSVTPGPSWKKLPSGLHRTRREEVWTWNGSQRDRTTLIDGLRDGDAITYEEPNADQQVPVFRTDMTAQDLMSMLEVSYRVKGIMVFDFESVEPVDFLGGPGVRLRYNYASGIDLKKQGSCVMRVVDGKLYAMRLDSIAGHYFDTARPEFDQLVASARLLGNLREHK
jgi:beta-barrel assembly-enhancing protease